MRTFLAVAAVAVFSVSSRAAEIVGDPGAGHVLAEPTAYTHPGGKFFVADDDVLVAEAGYAFTDRIQVSVVGGGFAWPEDGFFGGGTLNLEARLFSGPGFVVSAGASAGLVIDATPKPPTIAAAGESPLLGIALVAADWVSPTGLVSAGATLQTQATVEPDGWQLTLTPTLAPRVSLRLGPGVKLLVTASAHCGDDRRFDLLAALGCGVTPGIGLRVYGRQVAVDLGYAPLVTSPSGSAPDVPILSVLYRP